MDSTSPSDFAVKLAKEPDGSQFGLEAWELRAGMEGERCGK